MPVLQMALKPEVTQGINGIISPPEGEVCPAVIPAARGAGGQPVGEDITSNTVCCVCLRMPDPPQRHQTILLPGTVLDVSTLLRYSSLSPSRIDCDARDVSLILRSLAYVAWHL